MLKKTVRRRQLVVKKIALNFKLRTNLDKEILRSMVRFGNQSL